MPETRGKKNGKKHNRKEDTQSSESEDEVSNNRIFKKLKEMEKSLEFMATQFDQVQKENKEIKKMLKENNKENEKLKGRITELELMMEEIQKEKVKNNIVINGVEKQGETENTKEIVTKIMKKINIQIEDEMGKCYRKRENQDKSPIIIELKKNKTKETILKARKDVGLITTKDCQLKGRENNIFINEQLTNLASKLFYNVRELKKNKKIAYAWTREGNVYARKTETSKKVRIKSETDLSEIQ